MLFAEFFNPRNLYTLLGQTRAKYGADVEIVAVVPVVAPEMIRASDGDSIYGGMRSMKERILEKVDRCFPASPPLTIIGKHACPCHIHPFITYPFNRHPCNTFHTLLLTGSPLTPTLDSSPLTPPLSNYIRTITEMSLSDYFSKTMSAMIAAKNKGILLI